MTTPKHALSANVGLDIAVRDHMDQLRARSGCFNSANPLVSFLYTLMRDHVTPGHIEEILLSNMPQPGQTVEFCNGFLAAYAQDIALRITPPSYPEAVQTSLNKLNTSDQDLVKRATQALQQTIESCGDAGVIALAVVWAETLASEKQRLSAIIKDDNQEHS